MAVKKVLHDGAEAVEETGEGIIETLNRSRGRNVQVTLTATHARLQQPVTGWADTDDPRVAAILDAYDAGERKVVAYRIVVHRRGHVSPLTPWDELDPLKDRLRDLVELRYADPANYAQGGDQAKRDETPPNAASNGGAANPSGETTSAAPGRQSGSARPPAAPPPDAPARDRAPAPAAEAKPWEPRNTDGRLNLGSYAVTAASGMVGLAVELLAAQGPGPAGDVVKVKSLARWLLKAADAVQAANAHDGRVDRMDNLHTRARGAVRDALAVHPVPMNAGLEAVRAWHDELVELATGLLRTTIELTEEALA